jgi:hypothetical protein
MEELAVLISQYGFPIAISIYLLISRDKIISGNTAALIELKDAVRSLCEKKK